MFHFHQMQLLQSPYWHHPSWNSPQAWLRKFHDWERQRERNNHNAHMHARWTIKWFYHRSWVESNMHLSPHIVASSRRTTSSTDYRKDLFSLTSLWDWSMSYMPTMAFWLESSSSSSSLVLLKIGTHCCCGWFEYNQRVFLEKHATDRWSSSNRHCWKIDGCLFFEHGERKRGATHCSFHVRDSKQKWLSSSWNWRPGSSREWNPQAIQT